VNLVIIPQQNWRGTEAKKAAMGRPSKANSHLEVPKQRPKRQLRQLEDVLRSSFYDQRENNLVNASLLVQLSWFFVCVVLLLLLLNAASALRRSL
jgi:hypothetical protein